MAATKYHRFRGGERCDECGARQWYAQDAIRYCRNGHRLEGFAEHEGDEDAFGTQGKVSRKKKEPKKKIAVKLAGDEGRELYLEVLQLILLRQVWWLVREKGFPEDFEEIVRALWALRVRNLPLRESGQGNRKRKGDASEESDGYASSAALFSSQSEGTGAESSDFDLSDTTTATWAPDARRRWKLPKLVDSLALCYLGCLVRRLPATTADFCGWAQRGELEFLAAFNNIPRNVRDRLPAEYHRALQVRDHIPAGRLQTAVQELVISFKANFDTIFPPLNYPPILARLITELALPVEVYLVVKCITEVLKADYSYPIGGKKIRAMDNPEVLLAALVVVSAKLLYPLDGVERPPRSHYDPRATNIDWGTWRESMKDDKSVESSLVRGEEYKVTPEDALTMDKEKLDDFMDWFEKMWIGDGEPKTAERIREPFQGQTRPSNSSNPSKQPENTDVERIRRRYEAVNNSVKILEPVPVDPEDSGKQFRQDFCPTWRTPEELPDAARVFYEKAASIAAIPLHTLVRGATQVERRLEVWCIERAKERDREKGKDKGKGKAIWTGDDSV
ncbi:uncharacterized protein F4812DRAFT_417691 [Daldinia caldariorum]|uniref:uncharacterized protein n=1 Tax=Daldinia caldariorum TaxID=326644 RepID=UPI002008A455|nr:uncharacterized protein F4812DRAFT_417691 [Daldinia caldariorum]KAI1470463.1 hypothetical protein F4812DRAFT_417691 [Daldinia caldariorum]